MSTLDAETQIAIDPVCGMQVRIADDPPSAVHEGATWWFCSDRCQERFVADPARFTGPGAAPVGHGHGHGHEQRQLYRCQRRDAALWRHQHAHGGFIGERSGCGGGGSRQFQHRGRVDAERSAVGQRWHGHFQPDQQPGGEFVHGGRRHVDRRRRGRGLGLGQRLAAHAGLKVGWVSARPSAITTRRAEELKTDFLVQTRDGKVPAVERLLGVVFAGFLGADRQVGHQHVGPRPLERRLCLVCHPYKSTRLHGCADGFFHDWSSF